MANLSLSTIDQPAYQRAGGNLQPRSCGVRGRVLRTGTRPADRGDSPWTTPPRCPPPAPTRAPLAHELHKINNKFSMKRKNRKTRPFNLPLTSSSVALVQHFQHRQNKVPTTSPDRKTDSPPNSSVQAHVLIGKRLARPAGLEPAALGLEGRCSIRLSYGRYRMSECPLQISSKLVGADGFEPPTLCSQSRCATRLRHAPKY